MWTRDIYSIVHYVYSKYLVNDIRGKKENKTKMSTFHRVHRLVLVCCCFCFTVITKPNVHWWCWFCCVALSFILFFIYLRLGKLNHLDLMRFRTDKLFLLQRKLAEICKRKYVCCSLS